MRKSQEFSGLPKDFLSKVQKTTGGGGASWIRGLIEWKKRRFNWNQWDRARLWTVSQKLTTYILFIPQLAFHGRFPLYRLNYITLTTKWFRYFPNVSHFKEIYDIFSMNKYLRAGFGQKSTGSGRSKSPDPHHWFYPTKWDMVFWSVE